MNRAKRGDWPAKMLRTSEHLRVRAQLEPRPRALRYCVIHNGVAQQWRCGAVRRSRKAPDTNVGVAKHAAGIIGPCQGRARQAWLARRSPAARFGATPSRRVLSSARLGRDASRYTRMNNGVRN